jgi:hypothetical protein
MGIIMTFYVVVFSYFSHRILGVSAQTCIIYIFRFSHRIFWRLYSFYAKFNHSRGSVIVQTYAFTWLLHVPATTEPAIVALARRQACPLLSRNVRTPSHRFGGCLTCIKEKNEWIKRLQVHYIFVSQISLATLCLAPLQDQLSVSFALTFWWNMHGKSNSNRLGKMDSKLSDFS